MQISSSETTSFPPKPSQPRVSLSSVLDWLLKTLGLVSAIIFGIWAPMSYTATLKSNASNDEAQRRVLDELQRLSFVSMKMVEEMREVKNTLGKMGGLAAVEFCSGRSEENPACAFLFKENSMSTLLMGLVNATEVYKPLQGSISSAPVVTVSGCAESCGSYMLSNDTGHREPVNMLGPFVAFVIPTLLVYFVSVGSRYKGRKGGIVGFEKVG